MQKLQDKKFQILAYCEAHPLERVRDIAMRFDMAVGTLRKMRKSVGMLRKRGYGTPCYRADIRIQYKKRDRLQRELIETTALIATLEARASAQAGQ